MKVLHVSPDFPYPANHGGRVDIWGRMIALRRMNCDVDLIATYNKIPPLNDLDKVRGYASSVRLVRRSSNWRGVLSSRPIQYESRKGLADVPLQDEYDIVLLEGESTAAILDNLSLRAKATILRVQNDEAEYQRQMARSTKSIFRKLYYRQEAIRYEKFSRSIFSRVDQIWFISEDMLKAQPKEHHNKSCFIPGGLEAIQPIEPFTGSRQVIFVGTLSIATNQEAIRWYLESVHVCLLNIPNYTFLVAGNTRGHDLTEFISFIRSHAAVRILTDVDDLTPLYQQSRVFVNPMQGGTSVKMKTLNAAQYGLPIVTTSVGNEGTGFKHGIHLLVADDPGGFAAAVETCLTKDTSMAKEASHFLAGTYDQVASIKNALDRIGQP